MNIAILGATGTFGKALVEDLLQNTDYQLTLIARHAKEVYQNSDRIISINTDATNVVDLKAALRNIDAIYCAVSGEQLPLVAKNLVQIMPALDITRLIFMGAVGIYNEIPVAMDGDDNVDNEPAQVPNRKAVDVIEASDLNYTVLRPGYLIEGEADDYVLTFKGEAAKGYKSTIPSVVALAEKLLANNTLYSRMSVSITKDMT